MTDFVTIRQAKTQLSRLIARVEAGEEITLARGGRPVARLVPVSVRTQRSNLGLLRGRVWLAPDFDAPEVNEDIAHEFEA